MLVVFLPTHEVIEILIPQYLSSEDEGPQSSGSGTLIVDTAQRESILESRNSLANYVVKMDPNVRPGQTSQPTTYWEQGVFGAPISIRLPITMVCTPMPTLLGVITHANAIVVFSAIHWNATFWMVFWASQLLGINLIFFSLHSYIFLWSMAPYLLPQKELYIGSLTPYPAIACDSHQSVYSQWIGVPW